MSDEAFAPPTSSQTGAAMTPAGEGDYDTICAAVMETVRGRWFLTEFSRRNRHADTQLVLAALDRIERGLRGRQTPESVERLRNDLMEMARAIARAKAEIAGVAPADEGDPIADVSLELDSVVRATDEATSNILAAAAQIQEVAWTMREQGNDAGLADQLSVYAATIQSAASSQKLAGERTQKVVDVMRDLEGRINDMIDVWGGYPAVDNRLLANSARNTPALPPADFGQVEIDRPTDVEPQQNSSDEHDSKLQDLSLSTASPESSLPQEPRYLNDNGRASSRNGHLVLDPSIAAAIRDAASLTNTVGSEVNAVTTAQVTEVADTSLPGTPQDERSGDAKDADSSRELPDPQAAGGSHDSKSVMEVEAPEKSELRVEPTVAADAATETTLPQHEAAPAPVVPSEPVIPAGAGEGSADNAGPNTDALGAATTAASAPHEMTPLMRALAEVALSSSNGSETIVAPAPSAGGLAHPQAVAKTTAEHDQQWEPLAETQPDAHETHDAQEASAIELPAKTRPFVVIDLDLEPLPIGLDTQPPSSSAADTTVKVDAREISRSAREKEASPTAADPKPFGWLSEPVTALYDLPPLEVPAAAAPPSATTRTFTTSGSAPDVSPARPSQSGSRWPFAFRAPRLRTKPTATESAPTETTAPPPAVASNKAASAPATAVAFELGGLVVVAPSAASEPRRPAVAATSQPVASEPSTPMAATAALLASQPDAPVFAPVAAPAASKPGAAAVADPAPPESSKPVQPVPAEPVTPVVAAAAVPAASQPGVAAAAAPATSESSGPSAAAAVTPAPSATVSPAVAAATAPAASDPSGPAVAAAASTKPATSNAKALRPSPPPPSDPLAALAALSDEERLALFS
jgi:hypothetical protein